MISAQTIPVSNPERAQANPSTSTSQTQSSKLVQVLTKYHQGVKLGILTTLYQQQHGDVLEYKPMKLTVFLENMDGIVVRDDRVYLVDAVLLTPKNAASLEAVQANLVKLLAKMSLGIHLRNLENAYKNAYDQELEYECFGFPSLADLVESIPHVHIARKSNQKKYALVTIQNSNVEEKNEVVFDAPVKFVKVPGSANAGEQTPPSLAAATFSFDGSDAEEEQPDEDACSSPAPGIKTVATTPSASIYTKAEASPSPERPCFNVFGWISGNSKGRKLLMSP